MTAPAPSPGPVSAPVSARVSAPVPARVPARRRFRAAAAGCSAAVLALGLSLGARAVWSQDLTVDLTKNIVEVTTGFTGSDVTLYGAKSGPGDVIVAVRGPLQRAVVRRKANVAGVWANAASVTFDAVPAYYAVASNRALDEIINEVERDINQIGAAHLELEPVDVDAPFAEIKFFREALIRARAREKLYTITENDLIFLSEDMFRTEFRFPASVTTGTFSVDVFLVRDGEIQEAATKLLNVRKFGFGAFVYDMAHRRSWLYGAAAVIIACISGWAANAAFRRT